MTILCLGALLVGLAAAPVIPFVPFACALVTAVILGAVWAIIGATAVGQAALSAFLLLFACQVGYGSGIISMSLVGRVVAGRRRAPEARPRSARPLRTGNGPR